MARSEKLSTPEFIFCIVMNVIWSQESVDITVTMEETIMLTEIGTPRNSSTPNTINSRAVVTPILISCCLLFLLSSLHQPSLR